MKKFKIHNLRLLNEDCMDIMKDIPNGYYDWLITDPPYGIGADNPSIKNSRVRQKNGQYSNVKQKSYSVKQWDLKSPSDEYFKEMIRISKNQLIFGVNYFDYPFKGGRIVWDKLNGASDQYGCEIAYLSKNNRTDIVYYLWRGMMQGATASKEVKIALKQKGNKKLNEKRIHPTQKPVELYNWIYSNYIDKGSKVIDCFLGSGSNSIAAHYHGVSEFLGIEKDSEYFDATIKRIKRQTIQLKINI